MSERSQRVLVWWGVVFVAIYGLALALLLDMVPPPTAKMSADEIAVWYAERHDEVRIGAVIAGWTSAFLVPITVVIAVQMARQEAGRKVWSLLAVCGGAVMSVF